MTLEQTILKVDQLKAEYDKLLPMKREDEDRLWKKFRLEWNYNSNHIEGNTLTYNQTELLLIFDKATGEHDLREFEEMKAHDVAVKLVEELANDKEHPLTEAFIKQLNKIILVRPYWKEAITDDEQPTRKLIKIGSYKDTSNSVRLSTGEIFRYSSPDETPAMMGELMQFYKTNESSIEVHPVRLAAMMHYKFVLIHPFDDGNGRIARLLMNYILLKNNFPPVIIKSKDKKGYLTALNKADTGDIESFVSYISEEMLWSLDIAIKAVMGEGIEEADDYVKEIELLKRKKTGVAVKVKKTKDVIRNVFNETIAPFLKTVENSLDHFNELFLETQKSFRIGASGNIITTGNLSDVERKIFYEPQSDEPHDYFDPETEEVFTTYDDPPLDVYNIELNYDWKGFTNAGTNAFQTSIWVKVEFDEFKYKIYHQFNPGAPHQFLYGQPISEQLRSDFSQEVAKKVLEQIKQNLNQK